MPRTTAKIRNSIIFADHAAEAVTFEFADIQALERIVGRGISASEVSEVTEIAREYILARRFENAAEKVSAATAWLAKVRRSASNLREKLVAGKHLPFQISQELDPVLEEKLRDRPWTSRRINGRVSRETLGLLMLELMEACRKLEKGLPTKADPPSSGSDAFRVLVRDSLHWATRFGIPYSSAHTLRRGRGSIGRSRFFRIINFIVSDVPPDVYYKQSDDALAKAISRAHADFGRGTSRSRRQKISPA